MIEQINIALEQKRSGNFSAWSWKPAVGVDIREESLASIKVMKNEHPVLPSEQDIIVEFT